jgi:hypothetical protein
MYYLGACGLATSMRASGSWQSLLGTLTTGGRRFLGLSISAYVAGIVVGCLLTVVLFFTVLLTDAILGTDLDAQMGTYAVSLFFFQIGPALMFVVFMLGGAEHFLREAEQHIARRERITQGHRWSVPRNDSVRAGESA